MPFFIYVNGNKMDLKIVILFAGFVHMSIQRKSNFIFFNFSSIYIAIRLASVSTLGKEKRTGSR